MYEAGNILSVNSVDNNIIILTGNISIPSRTNLPSVTNLALLYIKLTTVTGITLKCFQLGM